MFENTIKKSTITFCQLNSKDEQAATIRCYWSAHRTSWGLNDHLYKIGKDINPLCRRCLNGNETVEHLLCECESLAMSWGRIFGQSFGELQQLSHVPVDLFRRFSTDIGLAGK